MRTIRQLAVPQNSDSKFPQSTIRNETETEEGTPVVEEIYGDLLTNIYKLLQTTGITPTGTQDSDETQYQILKALQNLPNELNDIEQILTLTSTVWSVPFNLDLLPNKYFFVARASDNYVAGTPYTFVGTTGISYGFTSSGFNSGDELLVVIDSSNVRAYSLSALNSSPTEIFTVLGSPLTFNDTNKLWYQEEGKIMSDVPSVDYLEGTIRVDVSDGTVLLNDIFVLSGYVLCFCIIPGTNTYFFRQFPINDFSVSVAVTIAGTSFSNSSDFMPYVYTDGTNVYVTNNMNTTANDYSFAKLAYNSEGAVLASIGTLSLDNTFVKTSNAVVKSGLLYTMISGVLQNYNLTSGVKVSLGDYSGVAGQLFGFNGEVYFTAGEVGVKWF